MRMILQIIISNGILDSVTGILVKISLGTGIWAKFRLGTGIWYPPSRPSGQNLSSSKTAHISNLGLALHVSIGIDQSEFRAIFSFCFGVNNCRYLNKVDTFLMQN